MKRTLHARCVRRCVAAWRDLLALWVLWTRTRLSGARSLRLLALVLGLVSLSLKGRGGDR